MSEKLTACRSERPKLQVRKTRPKGWTNAKQARFLGVLAESCNVTLAAEKAGLSSTSVYRHRRADASFRAAWVEALSDGYAALEMEMLKRALHGVEKVQVSRSGATTTIRDYDDRIGLALLRMHRDSVETAMAGADAEEVEEARARIVARLARLREKLESVETKASVDAVGLIRWAMARA